MARCGVKKHLNKTKYPHIKRRKRKRKRTRKRKNNRGRGITLWKDIKRVFSW